MFEASPGCRACGSVARKPILALGQMPLADALRDPSAANETEPRFPLTLAFCSTCSLVQILETVPADMLFDADYPYYSSFSESWLAHCRESALEQISAGKLGPESLVLEIACNDGYMLQNFLERDIPVLGIDPVPGPAAAAEARGIPVLREFFSEQVAERLRGEGRRADLILANNVLAHVPDLPGFVRGIRLLLSETGRAVIEVPWVRALVDGCAFDTIYHEHHCYFSATSLAALFRQEGLVLVDAKKLSTHGGSLRLTARRSGRASTRLQDLLEEERAAGVDSYDYYRDFASRVHSVRTKLHQMVRDLRAGGQSVAAYGAAAKGATLLNAAGIDVSLIDFVVDRNLHKHGKLMPGVRIPICDPSRLLECQPDYVLLLAWNLRDEILDQQDEYCSRGGRFIVPVPEPRVVT